MDEIIKRIKKKNLTLRTIYIYLSLFISALVYNMFLLPLSLVTGGTSSIATITYYLYDIDPSIMIFLISAACLLLSFLYLGAERTTGSILACIAYPIIVKLTSNINQIIYIDKSDILLIVIFAGVLSGVASGLMYKSGYSSGGLPIISQILFEQFKISVVTSSMIINIIIIIIGSFFFGITNALYAAILLYINNLVIDKVLLGISNNKAFYIITEKDTEVKEYIINNLNHTVTTFDVKGAFLEKKRKIMLTVIPTREHYKLTEGIKEIDKDAFFVVTDAYQVQGAK